MSIVTPQQQMDYLRRYYALGAGETWFGIGAGAILLLSAFSRHFLFALLITAGAALMVAAAGLATALRESPIRK